MAPPALTIITQWYPPEQAPFGRMMHELARYLAARGWDVTVITGFPNHPQGVVFAGYRKRWLLEETLDGVRVCRVWLATSARRTMLNRLATFATFTLTASLRVLRRQRPGLVFAVLQPLSLGVLLPLLVRMRGGRLVLNLQDLHPDTQIRLGMVRNPWLIRLLRRMERYAYVSGDGLIAICDSFRDHAIARGASAAAVSVIPNWVDTDRIRPAPEEGAAFRMQCGVAPGQFVALWAGTLGHVSGAMLIVEAAAMLQDDPRIQLLVVGEGPLQVPMAERVRALRLGNIRLLPFQPEERLAGVQSAGDVSIVTLAPEFSGSSVPSKLLAYLAAGRPVIAAAAEDSETAKLVHRAGAGLVVGPDKATPLADAVRRLADDPAMVRRLGIAAREHAVRHLSRQAALEAYEAYFLRQAGQR